MNLVAIAGVVCLLNGGPVAEGGAPSAPPAPEAAQGGQQPTDVYRVLRSFDVGGPGGWDLITVDPAARRLYVPRVLRVLVLNADSGARVGEIADTNGVHGVAIAPALSRGFTTNSRADSVTAFDLQSLAPIGSVKVGRSPDAIVYEPITQRVFVFNARTNDATVIDAGALKAVRTIPLGGRPAICAADDQGKVFVNIEDKSELLRIDAATLKIEQRTPLAPGEGPTGITIDPEHHRVFSVCRNELMVIVDGNSGGVLATPPIGKGAGGAVFDAASGNVLSANGEDGTITVVATRGEKEFTAIQTLATGDRARTIAIDPGTGRIYVPTAVFERAIDPSNNQKGAQEIMRPDTFRILVVGP